MNENMASTSFLNTGSGHWSAYSYLFSVMVKLSFLNNLFSGQVDAVALKLNIISSFGQTNMGTGLNNVGVDVKKADTWVTSAMRFFDIVHVYVGALWCSLFR